MSEKRGIGYDEVNDVGTVCLNACIPIEARGIEITVSEAWDDDTPRYHVLLTCHGGMHGLEYGLDVDRAEALGRLLLSAAKSVRSMAEDLGEQVNG